MTLYYITKNVCGDGHITVADSAESPRTHLCGEGKYLFVNGSWNCFGPTEWTTDKAEAIKRAEAKRAKKIASLQAQIAKLKKHDFNASTPEKART